MEQLVLGEAEDAEQLEELSHGGNEEDVVVVLVFVVSVLSELVQYLLGAVSCRLQQRVHAEVGLVMSV